LSALAGVAAQSAADRERFLALGLDPSRIEVLGSSKFDVVPWDPPPSAPVWIAGRPVLVAGSTREGDERVLAAMLAALESALPASRPLLLIAPRHLPRVPAVVAELARNGFTARRRSEDARPLEQVVAAASERGDRLLVLDTHGELAPAYRLGVAAIVGGGFHGPGGHNLLEPASRARSVAFGAQQVAAAGEDELLLAAGGGFRCRDAAALAQSLAPLVQDLGRAADAGRRARSAVERERGAGARIAEFTLSRLALQGSGG
jgi:3-deoxy-D-manno-octulosonic-acid transferase